MHGTLESVSVVVPKVVRLTPVVGFLIAHMTLADHVQYWLMHHRVIAHVVHCSRLYACIAIHYRFN